MVRLISGIIFVVTVTQTTSSLNKCDQRVLDEDHRVCVCNSTYCDTVPPLDTDTTSSSYQLYSTSKSQLGFSKTTGNFGDFNATDSIRIRRSTKYQTIVGFGGAFTDAAAINILSLPDPAKNNLLQAYFGEDGLGNSLCRVPIGGSDFSTRPYSYDEHPGDVDLDQWELQEEDLEYKVVCTINHFRIEKRMRQHVISSSPYTQILAEGGADSAHSVRACGFQLNEN